MGARWSIALLAFTLTERLKDQKTKGLWAEANEKRCLMGALFNERTAHGIINEKIQKLKHGIEFELSIRWAAQDYEVQRWIDHQKKSNEKNKC